MYIVQLLIIEKQRSAEILREIDTLSPDACILSEKTLSLLIILLEQTRLKLILFFQRYREHYRAPPDFSSYSIEQTFLFLMNYPKSLTESLHCAAHSLSVDYYNRNGSYRENSRFLFGTASQFCT